MEGANYHYETVTEAIRQLRAKGFTTDFNLKGTCIICNDIEYADDEFHITEIYRYEGESDPGDEATVYGIESHNGIKGILVTGDETDTDARSNAIIRKLLVNNKNK